MQLLELEHELRQCGVESERVTVDGSKVQLVAKKLKVDNNSFAASGAVSGFMAPLVSQAVVRTNVSNDYLHNGLKDMPNESKLDFSTLTVKGEETPKCSVFPSSSVGSPVKRLPGEFTPTYFQTSWNPTGNKGAVNSVNTDYQGVSQVPFSGPCLPKLD